MDATQADAEPTKSDGMDASPEVSRSVENDGNNEDTTQSQEAAPTGFDADLASVDSPEALAALMAKVTQEPPPGGDGEADETPAAPEAEAAPAQEEEPAPQPKKQQQEQTPEEEEDDAPLDLAKLPTRYRLQVREDDEVGRLAAALKKRNKDWSLEEAVVAARKRLGKDEPAPAADSKTAAQPKDEGTAPAKDAAPKPEDEVAALEAKVKELRAAKVQANKEVDLEKVAELDAELDEVRDKLTDAKVAAKIAAAAPKPPAEPQQPEAKQPEPKATDAAYDAKFDASLDRANKLYPDAAKADTPFAKRMAEIDRMLEKEGDPLFHSPDKPFRVAAMVAAELGVAPKSVTSSAKPAAPAAPKANGPRSLAPIASGESRTSTTRTQSAPTVAAIQGLQTPEDLENFLSKVGGTGF